MPCPMLRAGLQLVAAVHHLLGWHQHADAPFSALGLCGCQLCLLNYHQQQSFN